MRSVDLALLNPAQRRAVEWRGSPLLVLAGAGSGKTRVITYRVAHLIATGTPARAILGMTFTNKAAQEMRGRLADLVGAEAAGEVTLSTFHAFGARILREQAARAGLGRHFTILDARDQADLVRSVQEELGIDPAELPPERAQAWISAQKSEGPADARRSPDGLPRTERLLARVAAGYERALRHFDAVDFDDLLLRPLELFRACPDVLAQYRERFRQVLVDEYQDTNLVQLLLVKELCADHQNLCAVGDDDQSIYGWRGARVQNIWEFEKHFPGSEVLNLTRNYRSTMPVLALANAVMQPSPLRRPKELWTDVTAGETPRLVACPSDEAEAAFIAFEIDRLRHEAQLRPDDVAVLFRTNGQARALEEGLRLAAIPYRVVGTQSFFDRKEVKDALAYLRILVNPRDAVALRRALGFPTRGIGPATRASLERLAEARGIPLRAALRETAAQPDISKRAVRPLIELADWVDRHGAALETSADLAAGVELAFRDANLFHAVREAADGRAGSAEDRVASLYALIDGVRTYARRVAEPQLAEYLRLLALDSADQERGANDDPAGRVTLMTLHASKGLEFQTVFLTGLEDGLLPHRRVTEDPQADIEEERRLFYVGITRARRRLVLTRCAARRRQGGVVPAEPSRFLAPLPSELLAVEDRSAVTAPASDETRRRAFAQLKSILGPRKRV